jgi:hypothetical protein
MEAPGRLSDKEEDSMSTISLRNTASAVVLTALLGLSATPVAAQPRGPQEPSRIEAGFAVRVWRWLAEIWTQEGSPRVQEKSLAGGTLTTDSLAPGSPDRAGAFDPNG